VTITVFPEGIEVEAESGKTLLESLAALARAVPTDCGGRGTCGKCRVQILRGTPTLSDVERAKLGPAEIEQGFRLGCQQRVQDGMWIAFEDATEIVSQAKTRGFEPLADFPVDSGILKTLLSVPERVASSDTPWSSALTDRPLSLGALRDIASVLAAGQTELTTVADDREIVSVEAGDTREQALALGVDIGTTTIAVYLIDLIGGGVIEAAACANSQARWGADVVSRIDCVSRDPGEMRTLQKAVRDDINQLITEMVRQAGVPRERIYRACVVGNPTMGQLFLGIHPYTIGMAPYAPAATAPVTFSPSDVRLILPDCARCWYCPVISGYVGADSVAAMLAADMDQRPEMTLLIDVGTNGETMLGNSKRILCGSNAAGPAFEGARIRQGMRGAKGAIERVRIDDDVHFSVIGDVPPRGICGSGLIDAVAAMLNAGVIDETGRVVEPDEAPESLRARIVPGDAGNDFVLATAEQGMASVPVILTQADIREVQLAAGAIAAGRQTLCIEMGIEEQDLERVLIAGAFGSYIDPVSAMRMGLLPNVPLERVRSMGNAAGYGACMMAMNRDAERRALELSRNADYVEFASRAKFQELFVDCMEFPG
jgi:uncharacterized 2Fe-2S/4Fe-4S cluster protein (DUF4445 family)